MKNSEPVNNNNKNQSKSSNSYISSYLKENEESIREAFGNSADLVLRKVKIGANQNINVLIVYIEGLIDNKLMSKTVIKPITTFPDNKLKSPSPNEIHNKLKESQLTVNHLTEVYKLEDILNKILDGYCALIVEGTNKALLCDVIGFEHRPVSEPINESAIRGPHEGFNETIRVNTSLLRRRIKDPRLTIEELTLGKIGNTKIDIIYIRGLANPKVLQEIKNRIKKIKDEVDSIQLSGQLEEYIQDAPFSPFPTILNTERPDRIVGALYEGRYAILVDGTPYNLIVPCTLGMFITSIEDYTQRFFYGSFLRLLRWVSFLIALTLPSIYVAITSFHQEMLPTNLVLALAAQREGVPLPAVAEAFMMEIVFEILREAGIRMPRLVGPAISIVGVLVIGQAAVQAGLVSAAMTIIVGLTAIASFITPIYSIGIAIRLLRFPIIILAGSLGLFGISAGLLAILIHLTSLRSFGVPYFEPFGPIILSDLKDSLIRFPFWAYRTRPKFTTHNSIRQTARLKPKPLRQEEKEIEHNYGDD
ncbi:MAG: spore germination protein [Clostridia bacterium]|nr:spore germination protein [Clostridia bacterium]